MPTGAELDYVEITASVNITASTVAGANTLITGNAVAFGGVASVIAEYFTPMVQLDPTTTFRLYIALFEDGTQIGVLSEMANTVNLSMSWPQRTELRFTPTAGSHTYSVRGYHNAAGHTSVFGAGTGGVGSGVRMPAFLRLTQV